MPFRRLSRRLRSLRAVRPGRAAAARGGAVEARAELQRLVQDRVRGRSAPVVGLFSTGDPEDLRAWVEDAAPTARVHVWDPHTDPVPLHLALTAAGPFDLLVDEEPKGDRAARLRAVFFHLRAGGALVVRRARAGKDSGLPDLGAALLRGALAKDGSDRLAGALTSVTYVAGHLELVNGTDAVAKIREEEIARLIDLRGPGLGRVLETRDGLRFESRAVVAASPSERPLERRTSYAVPAVSLREYHHVLAAPGQVLAAGNALLPDSFRHNQRSRVANRHTHDLGPRFAAVRNAGDPPYLAGSYFYLDSEFRGHYGHALTEQLSRLWAWEAARAQVPDLKAILHSTRKRGPAAFEPVLYAAAGVPREDLVFVDGPVRVERVLAATPMMSQPEYIHPDVADVWAKVSAGLAADAEPRDRPKRFFCSRRHSKRACHNPEDVERLFADFGFEIVFPEDYSLPEQAAMFREAEVIGGYAGSALFNIVFATEPTHVVMIASESYTAQNEYMLASVLGHRVDVARCVPDVPSTRPGFDRRSFHSDFTFDLDREGRFVREILAGLS